MAPHPTFRLPHRFLRAAIVIAVSAIWLTGTTRVDAKETAAESANEVLSAVVRLSAAVPPDARTAPTLGTTRHGNGVVIDSDGLVLTIGYLILEAMSVIVEGPDRKPILANVVAYDHETGFGLVRAIKPLAAKPLRLGASSELDEGEPALIVSSGGVAGTRPVRTVSRREFTGYWEYLLESAIFTSPPHPDWSGAALVGRDGKLLGIGSLLVPDATSDEPSKPGNMFVPIDLLKPILGDLLADGRAQRQAKPWLGMISVENLGRIAIARVAPDGPAYKAGVQPGDIVVRVAGKDVATLSELYRNVWNMGAAGADVPLTVMREGSLHDITVKSGNRYDYLRLDHTY